MKDMYMRMHQTNPFKYKNPIAIFLLKNLFFMQNNSISKKKLFQNSVLNILLAFYFRSSNNVINSDYEE